MSYVNLEYLFEDPTELNENALPDYASLDFVSNGSHIYGEIMWPHNMGQKKHPCVIMLHGFPGSARNDDISHALCRIGCVVIVPHHRGAWGSQGKYLITHCVEDAVNLAQYAHSPDFLEKFNVHPEQIFLLGHSMGGNSALNAGKQLAFIRGLIMLAPYDPTVYLKLGKEAYIKALLNEGKILKSDGIDSIYEDIVQNKENLAFPNAFDGVKDKNILIFAAKYDTVSNNEEMILPLWKKLEANKTAAIQKLIEYPVQHGLLGRRILMIREIAEFIKESGE
ncbi:MAG: alpha/beta fold hydrolase [Treponema sp.]|nr:alpha/beta fold hydrolase [Treponema sp.]